MSSCSRLILRETCLVRSSCLLTPLPASAEPISYPTLPALVALRANFLLSALDPGNVLPELRGELPAGTGTSALVAFEIAAPSLALPPKADLLYPMDPLPVGGKTPRPTWPEGKLTSIVQIDEFKDKVAACASPIPFAFLSIHARR